MKQEFKLTFTDLTEGDVDVVCHIDSLCHPNPLEPKHLQWCFDAKQTCIKGTLNDELVCYCILLFEFGDVRVANITVKPEYQHKGIGTQLMDYIFELSKNNVVRGRQPKSVWLEVRSTNVNAIEFYKKLGFTQENVVKDHYTYTIDGDEITEDALILSKPVRVKL